VVAGAGQGRAASRPRDSVTLAGRVKNRCRILGFGVLEIGLRLPVRLERRRDGVFVRDGVPFRRRHKSDCATTPRSLGTYCGHVGVRTGINRAIERDSQIHARTGS
jgi:hypothetical protein